MSRRIQSVTQSWQSQSLATRVIRAWLGVTWIYAGWDKATDSGFLTRGSATFIGTQLSAYSVNSPIGFLFNKAIEHATLVGAFVMVAEFAIGIATLLWVSPTLAAFGGFAMSIGLWLASSWHVNPYFLASDSAYAVLWLAYFLTLYSNRSSAKINLDRRGVLRISAVAATAVIAAGIGKLFSGNTSKENSSKSKSTNSSSTSNNIIKLADIKEGATHTFQAANGAPAVLFRTKLGVYAYSAICTHEGCTVNYSARSGYLECPCHGAVFDPADGAKVLSGPAPTPLDSVKVAINGEWVTLV
ncbi:MAG: Rieske 2Fe-2S domain-containing protein [Actinobacteria bacterium]|nr:Rieske 2Fe-2S domain-containing protein [Actinomycetota bacterium]